MIERFLTVNLQKPFMAQIANTVGNVAVEAVVEPDGHLSNVALVKGIRPDCDQEALRVMRLFNAWVPARKAGQPVRQRIVFSVPFVANQPLHIKQIAPNVIHLIHDTDSKGQSPSDSRAPKRHWSSMTIPVDTLGQIVGDAQEADYSGKDKKTFTLHHEQLPANDGVGVWYQHGLTSNDCRWYDNVMTTDSRGYVRIRTYYKDQRLQTQQSFTKTGMVDELWEWQNGYMRITSWYPNGQLKQISEVKKRFMDPVMDSTWVVAFWDSTAHNTLREGNGVITSTEPARSRRDTTLFTQFVQHANYQNGLKSGVCTGAYADESYAYRETYDKGVSRGGYAVRFGHDTLRYAQTLTYPTFRVGSRAADQFIANTATYPRVAWQKQQAGIVRVEFIIDETGKLSHRQLSYRAYPLLDAEAFRMVDASANLWQPALLRGEPIRLKHALVFSFGRDRRSLFVRL